MYFRIAMVLFVVCSCSSGYCQGVRGELQSYLAANQANWEALRKFDVLIRTDTLSTHANSELVETIFERMVFDWESERFLYARRGERETIEGSNVETMNVGFIESNGMVRSYRHPGRPKPPLRVESRFEVFDRHRVSDLRLTIFLKHGRGPYTWRRDHISAYDTFVREAESVTRGLGGDDAVSYSAKFKNQVGYTWKFDTSSLMAHDAKWHIDTDDRRRVMGHERLWWKENNGIWLPDTISGEYTDFAIPKGVEVNADSASKHGYEIAINRDVRFEWIKVNEELDDKTFDFGSLDSVSEFMKSTDPLSLGVPLADE